MDGDIIMTKLQINNYYEKIDFSANHLISTNLHMPNFHFHDLYEVYFSLTSDIKCFINNRFYPVEKGDIFLFSSADFHRFVVPENTYYERYFLLFSGEYIKPLCTNDTNLLQCFENRGTDFSHRIHLNEVECLKFVELLETSKHYSESKAYGSDISKKISLAQILIFISSFYKRDSTLILSKCEGKNERVWPIIKYIDDNIANNLSLDLLSSYFYISKYYMEVMFKNTVGLSINEYIVHKRILKAKIFLKNNLSVGQVAEIVGFNSDSHFIRTFKKLVGISPKQYAKRVK